MPTYGYECLRCNEQFETIQRITEDALTIHENCGGELRRLLYPVGIVFKGPGFYVNDYAKKNGAGGKQEAKAEGSADSKSEAKAEAKTDSSTAPASETKSETKAEKKPAAAPTS